MIEKSREYLNRSIPHFYDSIDRNGVKEAGNRTNGFNKFPRFGDRDIKLEEIKHSPSTHSYNSGLYNTIEAKVRHTEPYSRNSQQHTKSIDRFEVHNYYKELEKGYVPKDTPGPGAYITEN